MGWVSEMEDLHPIQFGLFDPAGDVARLCLRATGTDELGRTCEERYVAELYRQASVLETADWGAEIDAWQARLDPALAADDPHREYDYEERRFRVAELRVWAVARAQQVRQELADAGYPPP